METPSASRFVHALLTRFNVRMGANELPSSDWLLHRLDLFKRFCLESVRAQTVQNFVWIVFVHSSTPKVIVSRLNELSTIRTFEMIFVDILTPEARHTALAPFLDRRAALITSRLDNDDAIRNDFMKEVQDSFSTDIPYFINFPKGYVLDEINGIYLSHKKSNAFISLVEFSASPTTTLGVNHARASCLAPVKEIGSEPMWIQVVHKHNLRNKVRPADLPIDAIDSRFKFQRSCIQSGGTNEEAEAVSKAHPE
ncbi:MAG: glycosyltransferase [Candidatus Sulfotelmatobacter sp.]